MLKFIRGKGHQPSAERTKLQKQLFSFKKTVQHGFPHHPTSLGFDPQLRLLAIGTKSGSIKIFGTPGVEFYGQHQDEIAVTQILFLPAQARLITLCDDNTLHLWEINLTTTKSSMEEMKSCPLEGKLKKVSSCCLQSSCNQLYLGTEGGNIYLLDVKSFTFTDHIIYQDVVMQNVPDDFKVNPGAVEAISEHPTDPSKLLIGYNRGLIVLWDNDKLSASQTYVGTQQLDSLSWHESGHKFMSSHNDGSYVTWNVEDSSKPEQSPITQYGPFPCKAISKLEWLGAEGDDYIIFTGGMPRASYGDRHTVTTLRGSKHVVFDFTSKVVDFVHVTDGDSKDVSLVVLAEEELLVVDLSSDNWPIYSSPYLVSLHSSAVTCCQHVSNVEENVWEKLVAMGKQSGTALSTKPWPINGGRSTAPLPSSRDLLLTGHEDGSVKFWNASTVALSHVCEVKTSAIFTGDEGNEPPNEETEEWPPFRKVGYFDPYSDDPRLAVKKLSFCVLSGTLIVGGTSGQVVVYTLSNGEQDFTVQAQTVSIVSDRDGFTWKGHEKLEAKSEVIHCTAGLVPSAVLQLYPPAALTALALHSDWGLIAVGSAHGFALFDYIQRKSVLAKCTLNPNDLSGAGDTPISRRKSLKKSLRESFRRLRKGRSSRGDNRKRRGEKIEGLGGDASTSPQAEPSVPTSPASSNEPKPIERQIEARAPDDAMGSMVRCLYLADSFIVSVARTTSTLWAGTNSGAVFVLTISIPAKEKRKETNVSCQLGKEIQLKHRAPVISITILDSAHVPIPDPGEVQAGRVKVPETQGYHRVLIASEEQFKIFTLPSLKPFCKFKLTAHQGARTRKVSLARFTSNKDPAYSEWCVTCLSNLGEFGVYSLPDLRRQKSSACIKKEDINGILSLVFTRQGEAFYLHSSSELQRVSLSTVHVTEPQCTLDLPEGSRPEQDTGSSPEEIPEPQTANNVHSSSDSPRPTEDKPEPASEVSILSMEEDRKEESADITIDSVRDHITTTIDEDMNVITNKKQERIEVNRVETVTTIVRNAVVIAGSEAAAVEAVFNAE